MEVLTEHCMADYAGDGRTRDIYKDCSDFSIIEMPSRAPMNPMLKS